MVLKVVSIYDLEIEFDPSLSIIWKAFRTVTPACLIALNSLYKAYYSLFLVKTPLLLNFLKNSL